MIRLILALALCVTALSAAPPKLPRPSPPFLVHLTPGSVSPAQFKGKPVILAFILTGCAHCQETVRYLSGLQQQHGSRGLQVLAAAFNEDASIAMVGFTKQFKPAFPVGYATRDEVLKYLGATANEEIFVPVLVFIDRKGMIRHLHRGDDDFFKEGDKNIRAYVEELLK
jgi:thiol-disulfide isomerase/thioredoxin